MQLGSNGFVASALDTTRSGARRPAPSRFPSPVYAEKERHGLCSEPWRNVKA